MSAKYEKHLFICINERGSDSPRRSCGNCGGKEVLMKCLEQVQHYQLKGKVRVNKSLCLDACEFGPAMVIYPEGLWYINVKEEDIEEIFETSVVNNGVVDRLAATSKDWEELKKIRSKEKTG